MRVGVFISSNGVRSIQSNVFDTQLARRQGALRTSPIARFNYFADGFSVFYSSAIWQSNFVRMSANQINLAGLSTTNYYFLDQDITNPHVVNLYGNYDTLINYAIFGQSGKAKGLGGDDSGEWILPSNPTIISSYTLTNSIELPNGNGFSAGQWTSMIGSAGDSNTWTKYKFDYEHDTWFGGWANSATPFAAVDIGETVNTSPGNLLALKNNIMWNPQVAGYAATFSKVLDIGNLTTDQVNGYGVGPPAGSPALPQTAITMQVMA